MKDRFNYFFPSIADVFFLAIFLRLSFTDGKGLLDDGDTGYHIRAGEFMLDTLSIPTHDIFSFLSPPLPWITHEWLSEVIMALVHKAFGLTGVVIFFSFVIASVYYFLFKVLQANKENIILAALIASLLTVSSLLHWLARPHIFSWVLMIIWYYLLDTYQHKDRNRLYLLPPIMLLWVNLHGGFMSGFILIGVYLLGNLMGLSTSRGMEREKCKEKARLLVLATVACLFVSLVNPHGYRILLFPFKLASDKFIMDHVNEFISPNFHQPMPFRYLLFLTIAIFAISKAKLHVIELTLILLFTHMALYSARYIPLFAIIAGPILLRQAGLILEATDGKLIDFFKRRANSIAFTDASSKGHLWPIIAVLVVCFFATKGTIEYNFDDKKKPVAAVEFVKRENIKGNMLNNDEFGDYLIYTAWPNYRVFIDGRSDMYGADRIREYLKVTGIQPGWKEVIEKYDINWIFYNSNSPLSMFLLERNDWRLIYADKVANIFVKATLENQLIIDKYPNVKLVIDEDKSNESK